MQNECMLQFNMPLCSAWVAAICHHAHQQVCLSHTPPPHLSPRLARKHQQQQSNEQTSRSPSLQPDELAKAVAHCVLSNSAADDATRQGHSRHSAAVIR
jgi:hypothetical protein